MTYKIAFFDVDGTLTDYKTGLISSETKQAIRALKEKGIEVVAATGRPLSMCEELKKLGIETFITANGGYVKHGEIIIHKVPMRSEVVKEVVAYAASKQHGLSFYTEDFAMNGVQNDTILSALGETLSLAEYPRNTFTLEEEVYLLCLFADKEAVLDYERKFPQLTFRRWHPYIVNVLDEDVSKSLAIKKVLQHFGFTPSQAIAFGDGDNDIDMLQLAGFGVAMGNGSEQLKEAADFVTKTSEENGIPFALKHLQIIS
ncbi:Cof-type HAD-IIB family hydrolase [Priestia koreensis]|uniref:Cof-type HAD-IIB family hydrolase n=1 Tax=Priestia koreensis TaxID=284581 RepID=UPI003D07EBFB